MLCVSSKHIELHQASLPQPHRVASPGLTSFASIDSLNYISRRPCVLVEWCFLSLMTSRDPCGGVVVREQGGRRQRGRATSTRVRLSSQHVFPSPHLLHTSPRRSDHFKHSDVHSRLLESCAASPRLPATPIASHSRARPASSAFHHLELEPTPDRPLRQLSSFVKPHPLKQTLEHSRDCPG